MALYNDGSTPFGSRAEEFFRAGASIGIFECETLDIKRPSAKIEKRDHINRPNGFILVPDYVTATATVQIPASADSATDQSAESPTDGTHLQNGDYFEDDFGFGTERFVVGETSDPFQQKDYRKQTVTLHLSPNPPASTP